MTKIELDVLYQEWIGFKNLRNRNSNFSDGDDGFITIKERENMIDILFKQLNKV